jgi:hypothetical protein
LPSGFTGTELRGPGILQCGQQRQSTRSGSVRLCAVGGY